MTLDTRYLYKCKYCTKGFTKEVHFMRHECKEMKRAQEVQTVLGQQAYGMYKLWLEKQRKKAPLIEGFTSSAFYTSFIKFAHYCREHAVGPNADIYIDLMVKQGISPALWVRPECYSQFLEHLDKKSDPYKQGEQTARELLTIAEKLKVDVSKVFNELRFGEVLELLTQRRLSPWLLFCSTAFKEWTQRLDQSERELMYKQIGIGYWADALDRKPEVVKDMKLLAQGLGL